MAWARVGGFMALSLRGLAADGKRAGSKKAVTGYVEEYVENLNRRATLGYSAYATRKSAK